MQDVYKQGDEKLEKSAITAEGLYLNKSTKINLQKEGSRSNSVWEKDFLVSQE